VPRWAAEVHRGPKTNSTGYGGYPQTISRHLGKPMTKKRPAGRRRCGRPAAPAHLASSTSCPNCHYATAMTAPI
jgi:hypothetical protein